MTKWLIHNKIIREEEKEVYRYGAKHGLVFISNIIITLIIATIMNMVIPYMIYTLSYISLRSYAGGYHAKNQKACYVASNIMVVLALITVNYTYQYPQICIGVLAISTLVIMKLAPVEAKNKPLDKMEVIVYRRKTITILWTLVLIALLLLFLDLNLYFTGIVIAIGCVSIMLILGKYLSME